MHPAVSTKARCFFVRTIFIWKKKKNTHSLWNSYMNKISQKLIGIALQEEWNKGTCGNTVIFGKNICAEIPALCGKAVKFSCKESFRTFWSTRQKIQQTSKTKKTSKYFLRQFCFVSKHASFLVSCRGKDPLPTATLNGKSEIWECKIASTRNKNANSLCAVTVVHMSDMTLNWKRRRVPFQHKRCNAARIIHTRATKTTFSVLPPYPLDPTPQDASDSFMNRPEKSQTPNVFCAMKFRFMLCFSCSSSNYKDTAAHLKPTKTHLQFYLCLWHLPFRLHLGEHTWHILGDFPIHTQHNNKTFKSSNFSSSHIGKSPQMFPKITAKMLSFSICHQWARCTRRGTSAIDVVVLAEQPRSVAVVDQTVSAVTRLVAERWPGTLEKPTSVLPMFTLDMTDSGLIVSPSTWPGKRDSAKHVAGLLERTWNLGVTERSVGLCIFSRALPL